MCIAIETRLFLSWGFHPQTPGTTASQLSSRSFLSTALPSTTGSAGRAPRRKRRIDTSKDLQTYLQTYKLWKHRRRRTTGLWGTSLAGHTGSRRMSGTCSAYLRCMPYNGAMRILYMEGCRHVPQRPNGRIFGCRKCARWRCRGVQLHAVDPDTRRLARGSLQTNKQKKQLHDQNGLQFNRISSASHFSTIS